MDKYKGQVTKVEKARDMGFQKKEVSSVFIEVKPGWDFWVKDSDLKLGDEVEITVDKYLRGEK